MKQLRLDYRVMGCRRSIIRQVPERWTELTQEQFLLVAQMYRGELDDSTFLQRFFRLPKQLKNIDEFFQYHLSEQVEFLADCRVRMDHFIIPSVGKLQAPVARLKGINFAHFMFIDTAFNHYVRNERDADLDRMIALLYIKQGEIVVLPDNPTKPLSSHLLDVRKRTAEVAKLDPVVKYAIFLNYVFIKRWLSKAFPSLFPLDESDDKEEVGKKKTKAPLVSWLDIFDAFVGDDIAQMEKYQQMPCATAFRLLDKRIRDAQKK